MENKNEFIKMMCLVIVWTLMFYAIGWICGWVIGKKNHPIIETDKQEHVIIDSLKSTLDSIKYNIIYKDSVIYRIKEEMKDEVEENKHLTDTAVVNEFYKLVSE